MVSLIRAALSALVLGVLSTTAAAQAVLTVPEGLVRGQDITITYSDPSKAGSTITVEIDNCAFPNPVVVTKTIQLDAQGKGSCTWKVAAWDGARFNAPDAVEVTRPISNNAPQPKRTL